MHLNLGPLDTGNVETGNRGIPVSLLLAPAGKTWQTCGFFNLLAPLVFLWLPFTRLSHLFYAQRFTVMAKVFRGVVGSGGRRG